MSYRDDLGAMQAQLEQLESELAGVQRERERLQQVVRDEPKLLTERDRLRRAIHARAPRRLPLLDDIRVASPCHERWDEMTGDAQARQCARCDKNVYNLSAMTREAAEALIRGKEGKLCVRYFRRTDGTILTADCPVGVRRKRMKLVAAAGAMTALAAGAATMFARMGAPPPYTHAMGLAAAPLVHTTPPAPSPQPLVEMQGQVIETMGDVAAPVAPPQPRPAPATRPRMGRPALRR
ncbi:MAG: hypothetical protein U0325_23300 [Polyangiales bacterium]